MRDVAQGTATRILLWRHLVLFPALALAGAVLGFNFPGDALRDRLDPLTKLEPGL
jgi:peptide/nickel transport system permease protein